VDRRNRAFVDCLNELIDTAGQREHCREIEDFVTQFSSEAAKILQEHPTDRDLNHEFGHRLIASLPLDSFGGNACRNCGLCDTSQKQSKSTGVDLKTRTLTDAASTSLGILDRSVPAKMPITERTSRTAPKRYSP